MGALLVACMVVWTLAAGTGLWGTWRLCCAMPGAEEERPTADKGVLTDPCYVEMV